MDNRDSIDFASENVSRLFRRLFVPTLVGMISMVVLNITDGAFVGRGVGSDALASINIVAPIFMLISGIGLMFGIGMSVVASIHLSHGKTRAARINVTQAMIGAMLSGALLSVVICSFPEAVIRLFGGSAKLEPMVWSYMKWLAWGLPVSILLYISMFAARLDGKPKAVMVFDVILAVMNIFFDWLLIYVFHLGLEGAAIATSGSMCAVSLFSVGYVVLCSQRVGMERVKLSVHSLVLTLRNLSYQVRLGVSALLGEVALAFAMIVGNYVFIANLGEDGVAAFSVGCYCLPIVFMLGNAIVQSVQPILSYAHGVRNVQRIGESLAIAFRAAVVCGLGGAVFMAVGAPWISQTFLPADSRAYALCVEGLPWFASGFFFIAINLVVIGYHQSLEHSSMATLLTLMRGVILMLPCAVFLPRWLGVPGMWLAMPVAEALTACFVAVTWHRTK